MKEGGAQASPGAIYHSVHQVLCERMSQAQERPRHQEGQPERLTDTWRGAQHTCGAGQHPEGRSSRPEVGAHGRGEHPATPPKVDKFPNHRVLMPTPAWPVTPAMDGRPHSPPLQALTHFVSNDAPSKDIETLRVTQGGVEVDIPHHAATGHCTSVSLYDRLHFRRWG